MRRFLLVLCLYWVCGQSYAELPKLSYLSEDAYPINYRDNNGQASGFSVELLKLIWQQLGEPEHSVKIMPWDRAYYLLGQKPNTVLFATVHTPKRAPYFKWVCAIDNVNIVLMGDNKRHPKLSSFKQLNHLKIGVLRADVGEQILLNNGIEDENLMFSDSYRHLIKLLLAKRVDFIAGSEQTIRHAAKQNNYSLKHYEVSWVLQEQELCYAFNNAVDDAVIGQFQHALEEVKQSSAFKQILTRYQQQKLNH
ncbi:MULTISPECIES: substrate-binding periplasmic protein [unclassified Agarivorans]|uniref:substrate-binding periplasmic protein n=1 Tax=unclassified Agarivorans TaxID=2636026 RepID=UPI0026E3BB71|nr:MULTISPECIES: transporter substrate-binding domain-containing protein [unclassified Agarivorans]MDO6684806.1 transporter substrate-binding domain-containing protein [Agarivorans sp. 3_MG-2023]MDO6715033.1 transporter substrate-binding domain-containing protein [Agarivorans sp. 2_MG-2023]